jgi:hypothetical protein
MKDKKVANILACHKAGRIESKEAIDQIATVYGEVAYAKQIKDPHGCLDYSQGYLRCDWQCVTCREIE